MANEREQISFDVLFVGAGPANLAGAIRLMQAAKEKELELEVALIEKGAELGSHGISGAILNPVALQELMPDYMEKGCPIETTIGGDAFYYLTRNRAISIPFIPVSNSLPSLCTYGIFINLEFFFLYKYLFPL